MRFNVSKTYRVFLMFFAKLLNCLVDLIGIEPMTSSMPFLAAFVNYCIFKALLAPEAPKTPLKRGFVPLMFPDLALVFPRR